MACSGVKLILNQEVIAIIVLNNELFSFNQE